MKRLWIISGVIAVTLVIALGQFRSSFFGLVCRKLVEDSCIEKSLFLPII